MNYIKLPSALILCLLLVFTSCSSDDDGDSSSTTSSLLIGSWLQTSSTFNGENEELDECDLLSSAVFTSTQITSTLYYGDECAMTESSTQTYSVDGNIISVTVENETYTTEILTLNDTTLTVKDADGSDEYTDTYTRQ
ncbi:lipocalin family protein [Patiriisocius sp. Uisw_017]|jgi:hypothetical protein|uniref:lipocalin family protein n=1 Tax=Patiriisocius sp. Uisw_017 TaxID=3230968 RepID=UPI0039E92E57